MSEKRRHHHDHDHIQPSSGGRLAAVIALNLGITLAEFIGGVLSGSLALISDAWHNLSDVASLVLGLIGEKVSARVPSARYTFGMKRFEVLIALINALALLGVGAFIISEAAHRAMNPAPINLAIMVPVACIGLAGNVLSIAVLMKNRGDNLNMRAAFLHLFYDTLSSVAVLAAAAALYLTGLSWFDLAASLMIAIMIFWSSLNIIRESLRIFLQGAPKTVNPDEVYRSIAGVEGVGSIHGLHIWSVNSTEVFLSCHVCASEKAVADTGALISRINHMLEKDFGITHTTLQIETSPLCGMKRGECCR
jgi:cobalt-zinc-cadmium efflux system protein